MSRLGVLAKFVVLSLAVVLLAASWSDVQAQNRQRQGRPRGRGFFRIDRTTLLRSEQVQKELNVTEEQKTKIDETLTAFRREMGELFGGLRDLSREERQKKFAELREPRQKLTSETQKKIDAILKDEQVKRLNEITLQVRGAAALADRKIAKQLQLSREQVGDIRKVLATQRKKQGELFASLRDLSGKERREKLQELREQGQQIRKETETNVLAVLSSEQKAQFEKMQGKKFELDRRALFQRRRGGQDRRRSSQ